MVIKRITAANQSPDNGLSREQAQHYWAETHGRLIANNANYRRYHHYFSVPEAYDNDPTPTFIGISMFWRIDPFLAGAIPADGWSPGRADDRYLFDRTERWPVNDQHAEVIGEEHVLIDGPTRPGMINAVFMVNRLPGLDHRDFFKHWGNEHAALASKLPGLRRYIQNHGAAEAYKQGIVTHDGWSELWFDGYSAFQAAVKSPEWAAMEADGRTLFCEQKGIVIGTKYVQKDETWKPRDYGALSMTEDEIRERLGREGYASVAADPDAPGKIKTAAAKGQLGVWTADHLVTLDESRIDARPGR